MLLLLLGGRKAMAATGPLTEADRLAFVKQLDEAFQRVWSGVSRPARILAIAQAVLESGWGRTTMARAGYNFFNITRSPTDSRPIIVAGDQDCSSGTCKPITQRFAKYGSVDEGVADYLRLISIARYADARRHLANGAVVEFTTALYRGGYFTLPLPEYLSQMQAIYKSVERRMPI